MVCRTYLWRQRNVDLGHSLATRSLFRHSFSTNNDALALLTERSNTLLQYLKQGSDGTNKNITLVHFDKVMMEWSKQSNPDSSRRAEELLVALEQNYDRMMSDGTHHYSRSLLPNTISYNHVLHAFAKSNGGKRAALQCDIILDRMMSRCRTKNEEVSPAPEPSVTTFNTAMHAWSKSGDVNAGIQAENIFRRMEEWNYDAENDCQSMFKGVQPNTRSLATVIDSWANSHHEKSFDRILAIFHHAVDKIVNTPQSENCKSEEIIPRTPIIPLNTVVFNSTLHGIANSSRGVEAAEKAQNILDIMQDFISENLKNQSINGIDGIQNDKISSSHPNTTTWSLLLKCWTNAVDHKSQDGGEFAASQAERVLDQMEQSYEIKPNAIAYTSCIKAFASSGNAKRALSILERMERIFEQTNDNEFKPTAIHYNACLSTYLQLSSKDTAKQAGHMFQRMQRIGVVDTVSFNTMMRIYLKNDPINSHVEVQSLYEQMKSENIFPDTITFNTMMDSWKRTGENNSTEKVIELLDHMLVLAKEDTHFTPDVHSFTIALQTIAKSSLDDKVEPARKIFHELISLHKARNDDLIKPDVNAFSAFLSTCANQNGSRERKRFALKLALGTYEQLCNEPSYGKPNSFIYGSIIKACGRLTSDDKEKFRLLEHTFKKCVKDGHLTKTNFKIFLKSAPQSLKHKILSGLPDKRLPFEWFRNVKISDRP